MIATVYGDRMSIPKEQHVRIYPDPQKWQERISKVPVPLRAKQLNEIDTLYEQRGFRATANGVDANGNWIDVSIKPGTSLQQVYSFLTDMDAACVTVQPGDVTRLHGRNPITLGLERIVQTQGARASGVELIEPDRVADAIQHISRTVVNSGEIDSDTYHTISADMVMNGGLDAAEVEAQDEWMEAKEEYVGLRYGNYDDPAGYAGLDGNGEWGTDEWGMDDRAAAWEAGVDESSDLTGDF